MSKETNVQRKILHLIRALIPECNLTASESTQVLEMFELEFSNENRTLRLEEFFHHFDELLGKYNSKSLIDIEFQELLIYINQDENMANLCKKWFFPITLKVIYQVPSVLKKFGLTPKPQHPQGFRLEELNINLLEPLASWMPRHR